MTDCNCEKDPCPCYGEGYSNGKNNAYFEIKVHDIGQHGWDCGCRPCVAYQLVAGKMGMELKPPPELPVYLDAQGNEHAEF